MTYLVYDTTHPTNRPQHENKTLLAITFLVYSPSTQTSSTLEGQTRRTGSRRGDRCPRYRGDRELLSRRAVRGGAVGGGTKKGEKSFAAVRTYRVIHAAQTCMEGKRKVNSLSHRQKVIFCRPY